MLTLAGMISSYSIIPALLLAVFKFRDNPSVRPFCWLIIFGAVVEISNLITNQYHYNNLWLINIFLLTQFYLIVYQLYKWKLFQNNSFTGISSLAIITILWVAETYTHSLANALNGYTLIFSSFFIVIFITVYINRLIFERIQFLLKEPRFLISIGLLIYFTTSLLVFIFDRPEFNMSNILFMKIWIIHDVINTFTNMIYAFALLCIPKR